MQRGINQIVSAVRPTLGPRPRVVAIENSTRDRTPELLDDGGAIVRRIVALPERNADMGAMFIRQVLWRVHEQVGDGTSTTAVLFQSIFDQGVRYVVAGGCPMQLRRHLKKGAAIILDQLSGMAKPLQGERHLAQIAESICHDAPLAEMMGEIFNILGDFGQFDVRSGRGRQLERQYVEGTYWDGGIVSRAMITDHIEQKTQLLDTSILVSDLELEDPQAMVPVLRMIHGAGISDLLIVASKVSDSVSNLLVSLSGAPERFQAIAAKTPGTAIADQIAAMEDLAVLVGGRPLVKGAGHAIGGVKLEDLGRARRAWANRHNVGIVGGQGDPRALRTHIAHLRTAFERATEARERRRLQERIGKLMGGSATLTVGGATELEIKSRKDLANQTADALRGAVRGGVVPGGGVSLLACRPALQKQLDRSNDTDERAAYRILIRAVEAPVRCILTNAGHDASEIMASMGLAGDGHGFDVRSGKIAVMTEAGIWDAAAVMQAAVNGAVAGAALALTTDVLVQHKNPQTSMQP
jgi:chaperonin GroEL